MSAAGPPQGANCAPWGAAGTTSVGAARRVAAHRIGGARPAAGAASRLGDALGSLGPAPPAACEAVPRARRRLARARAQRGARLVHAGHRRRRAGCRIPRRRASAHRAGLVAGRARHDALGARGAGARRSHRARLHVAALRRGRRLAARDVARHARSVRRRAPRLVETHGPAVPRAADAGWRARARDARGAARTGLRARRAGAEGALRRVWPRSAAPICARRFPASPSRRWSFRAAATR